LEIEMLTRRKTLAILGGGAILAAGGMGYRATRTPDVAIEPWAKAGGYEDIRRFALSYAILAPNPHNRQPWLVDLSPPDQVTLFVDTDRMLPHTDPFNRQIVVGLGCFLEVMRMAAAERGYGVSFDLFPQGMDEARVDARPVAIASFVNGASADPLFAQVLNRRSQKVPYDVKRSIPYSDLSALEAACVNGVSAGSSNETDVVRVLRQMTNEALVIELETPRTYKESVDLFRIGRDEVNAEPDGIDFSGPLFETMHMFGVMTREAAIDPNGTVFSEGMKAVLANTDTAMGHIWLTTAGNSRVDQINAGRDWVRLHLAATALGIAVQPLSQILQEYPEMEALYDDIHKMLVPDGGTVQMLARLGYTGPVDPSPRWPLEEKILNG
jgi:hypothetical protein